MGTVFVFEPDADYGRVDVIRKAQRMPVRGLKFVASVTGRWKLLKIVDFEAVESDLAGQLDLVSGADENAIVMGQSKIRKSTYGKYTALIRIDVDADANLDELRDQIVEKTGTDDEVDIVMGDFDMLAVVVDNDEVALGNRIRDIRGIEDVKRTETLRVMDYVSTSEGARDVEGNHYVDPFGDG
jgi:DNA-binding Lrp family transcriptional regulator